MSRGLKVQTDEQVRVSIQHIESLIDTARATGKPISEFAIQLLLVLVNALYKEADTVKEENTKESFKKEDGELDINSIDELETDEIIKEFDEKQHDEFMLFLVDEIKGLRKRVKKLERILKGF